MQSTEAKEKWGFCLIILTIVSPFTKEKSTCPFHGKSYSNTKTSTYWWLTMI
jgi:hypothetical protein